MTAEHQLSLILNQIKWSGNEKSNGLCGSMAKGGGNNGVTYFVDLYEQIK